MHVILIHFSGKPRLASCLDFYRATLCVSMVFAVARCPSICPSLCHVGGLYPDGWRYHQTSFLAWQHSGFLTPSPNSFSRAQNTWAWKKLAIFDWNHRLSQKR